MNQSQQMIESLSGLDEAGVRVGDKVTINMGHPAVKEIIGGPGGAGWKKDIDQAGGPFQVTGDRGMKSGLVELKVGKKTLSAPVAALKKV